MPEADRTTDTISLFSSQLQKRRFDEGTLRILESVLASKDVRSLIEIRSISREILRTEAVCALHEIKERGVDQKLSVVGFLVRAFALVGDVESCLALKYEALVLRELEHIKHPWLQVSYEEWLTFAADSLDNGYYSIAVKGYENALLSIRPTNFIDPKPGIFLVDSQLVEKVKKLRDVAMALVDSHSVQAQTSEYLRKKPIQQNHKCGSTKTQCYGSTLFRNGIKKRNLQKLRESQRH